MKPAAAATTAAIAQPCQAVGRAHTSAAPAASAMPLIANALSTWVLPSWRGEHEAGVDPAERELVAQHPAQRGGARLADHVVEGRAALADGLEVAGRGDPAAPQPRDRHRRLDRAARAERVAEV